MRARGGGVFAGADEVLGRSTPVDDGIAEGVAAAAVAMGMADAMGATEADTFGTGNTVALGAGV